MITPRLNMIISHIYTRSIADIGTDHAYIPISLAMENKIDRAIATDLRKGPLLIAEANIKKYSLENKIELRLGSGISPVAGLTGIWPEMNSRLPALTAWE